jgi:hypothetical protein
MRYKSSSLLMIAFVILTFPGAALAAPRGAKDTTATEVGKVEVVEQPEAAAGGYQAMSGSLVVLSGGYFMPRGEMAKYLNPDWSVKLSFQRNRSGGGPVGLGIDALYSYPKDVEVAGGIIFGIVNPYMTITLPMFGMFDLQVKGGAGVTVLNTVLDAGTDTSVDMTLNAGGGISRVFGGAFYIGLGADYYYIFERKNLSAINAWFGMGYRW